MGQAINVVIPVFNGAPYLAACVESVRAQTHPAAKIVVVDDGSDDDTPAVAAGLNAAIVYERTPHGGAASARNRGRELVDTEFIAFLDCDDLWLPTKLERQMAALAVEDGPVMVCGHVQQFVSEELSDDEIAALKYETEPVPGWSPSTILLRVRDFDRVGPFDPALRFGEFAEWFARARDAGVKPLMLPQTVCHRRLHRNNHGRRNRPARNDYAHALKKVLDRRRGLA